MYYSIYNITIAKHKTKKPLTLYQSNQRHQSKNIKKGSSIITGAKEKDNEEN